MISTPDDARLGRAFNFTAEDLETNRVGQLTARQQARLAALRALRRRNLLIALLVVGVCIVTPVIFLTRFATSRALSRMGEFVNLGLIAVILVIICLVVFITEFVRGRDLRSGRVSQTDGEARHGTEAARVGMRSKHTILSVEPLDGVRSSHPSMSEVP